LRRILDEHQVDIDRSRAETDRSREATELMQERNERIGRQIEAFPWNSSVLQDEIDHQHSLNEVFLKRLQDLETATAALRAGKGFGDPGADKGKPTRRFLQLGGPLSPTDRRPSTHEKKPALPVVQMESHSEEPVPTVRRHHAESQTNSQFATLQRYSASALAVTVWVSVQSVAEQRKSGD
jgi:hypothetical protein